MPTGADGENTHEERKRGECPGEGLKALDNHQGNEHHVLMQSEKGYLIDIVPIVARN